jgi:hypothetical protein
VTGTRIVEDKRKEWQPQECTRGARTGLGVHGRHPAIGSDQRFIAREGSGAVQISQQPRVVVVVGIRGLQRGHFRIQIANDIVLLRAGGAADAVELQQQITCSS